VSTTTNTEQLLDLFIFSWSDENVTMRMSTVYVVRRTLGILVVLLVLITLYWNYQLHITNRKQGSQHSLDSLNLRNSGNSKNLNGGSTSGYEYGSKARTAHGLWTTHDFSSKLLRKLLQVG
jgi:hypothetical protein